MTLGVLGVYRVSSSGLRVLGFSLGYRGLGAFVA